MRGRYPRWGDRGVGACIPAHVPWIPDRSPARRRKGWSGSTNRLPGPPTRLPPALPLVFPDSDRGPRGAVGGYVLTSSWAVAEGALSPSRAPPWVPDQVRQIEEGVRPIFVTPSPFLPPQALPFCSQTPSCHSEPLYAIASPIFAIADPFYCHCYENSLRQHAHLRPRQPS